MYTHTHTQCCVRYVYYIQMILLKVLQTNQNEEFNSAVEYKATIKLLKHYLNEIECIIKLI